MNYVEYGKENSDVIIPYLSAAIIHKIFQDSFLYILPNMYHGEFSINLADDYVGKILEVVKQG